MTLGNQMSMTKRRPFGKFEQLEPRMLLSGDPIILGPQTQHNAQPHVDIELLWEDPEDPAAPPLEIGPYGSVYGFGVYPLNYFVLDTGTNAILSAKEPTLAMKSEGYQTEGEFLEQGVAGYTYFDVSAPYRVDYTGTDAVTHTLSQTEDDVRILSSESVELGASIAFGGVAGLIGMPAMSGGYTMLDMSTWADWNDILDLALGVTFPDNLTKSNEHRYSVSLTNTPSFDPLDGQVDNGPLPSWGSIPFLNAVAGVGDNLQPGNFLVDTGAQISMLSTDLAVALGLDWGEPGFADDAFYFITVGGVGGTLSVPVLLIDQLRIPTQQGVDLVWTGTDPDELGLEVIVLDIHPEIDGILGVDLLTSGMDLTIDLTKLEITTEWAPYFKQVNFDFTNIENGDGTLYFDLHPYRAELSESDGTTLVEEGGPGDTYTVVLRSPPADDVTVDLLVPDSQVTAVDDAEPDNDFIVFTPENWDTPQTVRVTAFDDALPEGFHRSAITHQVYSDDSNYDNIRVALVTVDVLDDEAANLLGQHTFYNNSAWDDPARGRSDDDAIATDKRALLPGEVATFAHYTSYSRGLNGVMIDIHNMDQPELVEASDFELWVGNVDDPAGWTPAPPVDVELRAGAGRAGADRVTLVFDDGAIENQWLEVSIPAGGHIGLAEEDVFYFGNAVGETGNALYEAEVDAYDALAARNHPHSFWEPAAIDNPYDFNRDERVDAIDTLIARNSQTWAMTELPLLNLSEGKATTAEVSRAPKFDDKTIYWPTMHSYLAATTTPSPATAAHDAVLEQAVADEPLDQPWAWWYEFEQTTTDNAPTKRSNRLLATVDQLMTHTWP